VRGVRAVAIAASTGGPPALLQVLSSLPSDFPAPILIVQHIAEGFTDGFVSWLDSAAPLHVKIAEQQEGLQPGVVYVAPENRHLGVSGGAKILLSNDEPIGGFRPSANYLFDSVGRTFRRHSIGVILTGMGDDGVTGLATLRSCGGYVIGQDEESCVVYGMPGAANHAGVVDVSLHPEQICHAIVGLACAQ
jgi:two-component system chemotaxis response regulator CheB